MTPRPRAALMMAIGLEDVVLDGGTRTRLEAMVDLVSPTADAVASDLPADIEILVTGWGCPALDAGALACLPVLRLVAHAAGTVRPLATEALWARDITVTSAAAANAIPVAEFTFAAIVMIAKDVFGIRNRHRAVRGREPVVDHARMGTRGRRIGLVGASTVGRLVVERLRTLEVDVVVADPFLDEEEAVALGVGLVGLEELLSTSDVVSLHAPLLDSTRRMVGADQLARMPDGAWLLNTAQIGRAHV